MKLFLNFLCCFLVFSLPIQNVILKKEEVKVLNKAKILKAPERSLRTKRNDRKLQGNPIIELILLLILIYMVFNAPIWGIALLTLPLIFGAASDVQDRRLSQIKKAGISTKLNSFIKRKLTLQDKKAYKNAKKIFKSYFKKYHPNVKGKLNERKLAQLGIKIVKNNSKHFGKANYDKAIKYYAHRIFKKRKHINKLINSM